MEENLLENVHVGDELISNKSLTDIYKVVRETKATVIIQKTNIVGNTFEEVVRRSDGLEKGTTPAGNRIDFGRTATYWRVATVEDHVRRDTQLKMKRIRDKMESLKNYKLLGKSDLDKIESDLDNIIYMMVKKE